VTLRFFLDVPPDGTLKLSEAGTREIFVAKKVGGAKINVLNIFVVTVAAPHSATSYGRGGIRSGLSKYP
jgi:hypothetical protein